MSDKQKPPKAMYGHCVNAYNKMLEYAQPETMDDGERGIVYEGFLTALFEEELHLSTPYYTYVMKLLKKMGCARQLRRGGSSTPSQWLLIKGPSLDLFERADTIDPGTEPAYAPASTSAQHTQQIHDLNERVNRLERALGL